MNIIGYNSFGKSNVQDFLPYDQEMFQNGNINISGFNIINKDGREYWSLKKHLKTSTSLGGGDDVSVEAAVGHDAMLVTWHGFAKCLQANDSLFHGTFRHRRFFNRGFPGLEIKLIFGFII